MKVLFILNDPPYGSERAYNALRLAHALVKKEPETAVTVFLIADSVLAAKSGQKTPDGYYNIERMLKRVLASRGEVLLCATCCAICCCTWRNCGLIASRKRRDGQRTTLCSASKQRRWSDTGSGQ